jgi:hypothetical protein
MKEKPCKARGGGWPGGGLDGRRGRESQGVHDEGPAPSGGGREKRRRREKSRMWFRLGRTGRGQVEMGEAEKDRRCGSRSMNV